MDFVIAVDGPAASGKGTVASRLAEVFAKPYLDTGLLYRGVGVLTQASGALDGPGFEAAAMQAAGSLEGCGILVDPRLRSRGAGELASLVAAIPQVRGRTVGLPAALRSPAGRSRAGRARHRHRDRARCGGQAVRHRLRGGSRGSALAAAHAAGARTWRWPKSWRTSASGTRATAAAPPHRWRARPTPSCSTPPTWIYPQPSRRPAASSRRRATGGRSPAPV